MFSGKKRLQSEGAHIVKAEDVAAASNIPKLV